MSPEVTIDLLRDRLGATVSRDDGSAVVSGVAYDSRRVERGDLFCCVPGAHVDGHDFAGTAADAGAVALLVDHDLTIDLPQLRVADVRRAMATASSLVAGDPSHDLVVIGVTGTNGKTTVTHLLEAILLEAGRATAVLGTLSGAAHHTGGARSPDGGSRPVATTAPRWWRWRCRRTRSRCTGSTAPASPRRCSRTSRGTTSTSTRRWSRTSRPRPGCSRRSSRPRPS